MYYTYAYLREDKTPYYIGKGKEYRAWCKHTGRAKRPTDRERIVILKEGLSEEEAHKHETYLISVFGRIEDGGILYNTTLGGDGVSGLKHTEETKKKLGLLSLGRKEKPEHLERRAKIISDNYHKKPEEYKKNRAAKALQYNTQKKEVELDGKSFPSLNACARYCVEEYGVSRNTALRYLNEGRHPKDGKQSGREYKGEYKGTKYL